MIFEGIASVAVALSGAMLGTMAVRVRHVMRLTQPPRYTSSIAEEADLPSVTVCIPARNEQHALTECLEAVLASTYEKLEVIVLDDVSGDDTSALIKSFASSGVRFVKGTSLPKGWLGKNHALQGLLKEASGSYLLFMDVDTRLSPTAIENIVRYTLSQGVSMVSVLPHRQDGWRSSTFFSPLRYFWEVLFSRKDAPATASNAWLIRRTVLERQFGGFESVKQAIQPEAAIAIELAKTRAYRFLVSNPLFGVAYEKKWRSQLVTSVRLLFPLLHFSVPVALFVCIDLLIMLWPWLVLATGLVATEPLLLIATVCIAVGYSLLYAYYTRRVWKHGWALALVLWPCILIQELLLVIASVIQYRRKAVTWKGRSIQPEA